MQMESYCISKLEEQDFLIFQAAKVQPEEMRGLSVAYDTFPIIALNRKDEPSARLFTLLHELVHIMTRTSGICNDMSQDSCQAEKNRIVLQQDCRISPGSNCSIEKQQKLLPDTAIWD